MPQNKLLLCKSIPVINFVVIYVSSRFKLLSLIGTTTFYREEAFLDNALNVYQTIGLDSFMLPKVLGWKEKELERRLKSDPAKLAIAESLNSKLYQWRKADESDKKYKTDSAEKPLWSKSGATKTVQPLQENRL
jgi:hypothetical protein